MNLNRIILVQEYATPEDYDRRHINDGIDAAEVDRSPGVGMFWAKVMASKAKHIKIRFTR